MDKCNGKSNGAPAYLPAWQLAAHGTNAQVDIQCTMVYDVVVSVCIHTSYMLLCCVSTRMYT